MSSLKRKAKYLAAILALMVLIVAGAGVALAHDDGDGMSGQMMGEDAMGPMGDGMMGGSGMGSMMHGGRSGPMGSFDEEKPFDLQFIDQMVIHHQGAIVSSEHMISDSGRPELRKLAESIQKSQSEQLEQMRKWRQEWYPDADRTFGMMDPTRMDAMMEGMMGGSMREMMGGDTTDAMFLGMMIPHHQLGIDMAEQALKEAEHPELKELAHTIIEEQSAEIELMKEYLKEIEDE